MICIGLIDQALHPKGGKLPTSLLPGSPAPQHGKKCVRGLGGILRACCRLFGVVDLDAQRAASLPLPTRQRRMEFGLAFHHRGRLLCLHLLSVRRDTLDGRVQGRNGLDACMLPAGQPVCVRVGDPTAMQAPNFGVEFMTLKPGVGFRVCALDKVHCDSQPALRSSSHSDSADLQGLRDPLQHQGARLADRSTPRIRIMRPKQIGGAKVTVKPPR